MAGAAADCEADVGGTAVGGTLVGGTAVGRSLLTRIIDSFPIVKRRVPNLRMIVVAGPRIDPA